MQISGGRSLLVERSRASAGAWPRGAPLDHPEAEEQVRGPARGPARGAVAGPLPGAPSAVVLNK